MSTSIPIENIYYLLCYAWGYVQQSERVSLGSEQFDSVSDLLAHLLTEGTAHLLSRGLDQGYQVTREDIRGVRGKIILGETIKRNRLASAQVVCEFDEFTRDVPHNQIVKAALGRVMRSPEVKRDLRRRAYRLRDRMSGISDVPLTSAPFRRVQLHSNNRVYSFLLDLARLIAAESIVDEASGSVRFVDFSRDEARMGELFEEFVRNFLKAEQDRYAVSSPHLTWFEATGTDEAMAHLPTMRTDIVLEEPGRVVVIDSKFYNRPLIRHGLGGNDKVRSAHLYQISTYVEHMAAARPYEKVEGLLLYARAGRPFSLDYSIKGRRLQAVSLDLRQAWPEVHNDLVSLVA